MKRGLVRGLCTFISYNCFCTIVRCMSSFWDWVRKRQAHTHTHTPKRSNF